jgi:hypothetical protein
MKTPTPEIAGAGASYAAFQQQRGRLPDLIEEAIQIYNDFMADDNYDAYGCLEKVADKLKSARDFYDASRLASQAGTVDREALIAALESELGDAYDCTRVWEAWSVGTMSEDDFSPVTERTPEIADAILAALNARAGAIPDDVVDLVVAVRELLDQGDLAGVRTDRLWSAVEKFASRVCYDDEGGSIPEAHADPCTCGLGPLPAQPSALGEETRG